MRLFLIFILLLFIPLQAKTFSYAQIHRLPTGVAKDYYIWRFLRQKHTSRYQAMRIIKEASAINNALKIAYRHKTGKNPPKLHKRVIYEFRHRYNLAPKRVKLSPRQRAKLLAITRRVFSSHHPISSWLKLNPYTQLFVFKEAGKKRRRLLNTNITQRQWQRLSHYLDANVMLYYVRKEHLNRLSRIWYYRPAPKNAISYKNLMRMGFNALNRKNTKLAEYDFALASRAYAYERVLTDRALFWAWKAKNNRQYLHKLVKSYSINFYTLIARDALHLKYNLGVTPKAPHKIVRGFNISNPIQWDLLKRKIFNPHTNLNRLAKRFYSDKTIAYWMYIEKEAKRGIPQYFPMPYRRYMRHLSIKRQAIIYAIAKQESKFIPASISRSFALGMMQIMPFLVNHLAKIRHERVDYDRLFNPIVSLKYANTHLNYLTKWIHHPLFVAYAYNAGIGYTKRLIRRRDLFENKNRYDPWISLERVSNYQANDYGKKVLANYVIYLNKLGYHIRLSELVSVLSLHKLTDNFRSTRNRKNRCRAKH